jgi:hypothetical protein
MKSKKGYQNLVRLSLLGQDKDPDPQHWPEVIVLCVAHIKQSVTIFGIF